MPRAETTAKVQPNGGVHTMDELARAVGLAKSTVSMALNNRPGINPATRQRVLDAAQRLRYRPDAAARTVRTGRSRLLAVLLPRLTESFFHSVLQGVEDAANERGYDLIVRSSSFEHYSDLGLLDRFLSRSVDGLVLYSAACADAFRKAVLDTGLPTVFIGPEPVPEDAFHNVIVDNDAGARLAARHLFALGHRRIVYFGARSRYGELRYQGARAMLEGEGLELPALWVGAENHFDESHAVFSGYLEEKPDVTAVCCGADNQAAAVCRAAIQHGLRLPDDLSVTGFDDLPWTTLMTPSLTTVNQPQAAQGRVAMEILAAKLNGEPVQDRILVPTLVSRDSTTPPRR